MFRYLKHHFKAAAELLAFGGLVVGLVVVIRTILGVASAEPTTGLSAVLGEGIDVFGGHVGSVGAQLSSLFADSNTWVAVAALTATAVTVVSAFRQVSEWVHGPSDASALVRHAVQRATDAVGIHPTRIGWGVVRDAQTGQPLPLARVSVLGERGDVIAQTVADTYGRYGFHLPADAMQERGGVGGFHAQKDGYHHRADIHPVNAGLALQPDITMRRHAWLPEFVPHIQGAAGRFLRTAAFWTGVGTVPMAYMAQPDVSGQVMIALFAFSAIVRAVGSRRQFGHEHTTVA